MGVGVCRWRRRHLPGGVASLKPRPRAGSHAPTVARFSCRCMTRVGGLIPGCPCLHDHCSDSYTRQEWEHIHGPDPSGPGALFSHATCSSSYTDSCIPHTCVSQEWERIYGLGHVEESAMGPWGAVRPKGQYVFAENNPFLGDESALAKGKDLFK